MRAGSTNETEVCSDGMKPVCLMSGKTISFNKWYHVAGVHDGKRGVRLYLNGVREKSGTAGSDHDEDLTKGSFPATLGFSMHKNTPQRFMDIVMDEARFSNVARSDDWVKLNYESQKEGQKFVTFGTVENLGTGITGPLNLHAGTVDLNNLSCVEIYSCNGAKIASFPAKKWVTEKQGVNASLRGTYIYRFVSPDQVKISKVMQGMK
jgi:hypothetical protein